MARRRLRNRAIAGTSFALVLALGVAATLTFGVGVLSAHGHRRDAGRTAARSTVASKRALVSAIAPAAHRSRLGLPLGVQPLPLTLAGPPEPVQVSFQNPPRAGLLFNLDTGRVLWELDPTRVLPIASLTKMMTALLVVRSEQPSARVLITRNAVETPGSKVGLLPIGKRIPVDQMLYGLLLPSGNDAAVALAESVSGRVGAFVERMNLEAAKLGLGCTRYVTPDGLEPADSSCPIDLAELAYLDLAQPRIAHIVRDASAVLPFPIKGGKLYLYNNNPLLRYHFPGTTGMKTGDTEEAGLCLVGTAERDGVRLGVVLLNSSEIGRQGAYLLERAFTTVYHQRPVPQEPIPPGL